MTSLTIKVCGVNPNTCTATPEIAHDPIAGASSVVQVLTLVDGPENRIVGAGSAAVVNAVVVDSADRGGCGWRGDYGCRGGGDQTEGGNGSGQHF